MRLQGSILESSAGSHKARRLASRWRRYSSAAESNADLSPFYFESERRAFPGAFALRAQRSSDLLRGEGSVVQTKPEHDSHAKKPLSESCRMNYNLAVGTCCMTGSWGRSVIRSGAHYKSQLRHVMVHWCSHTRKSEYEK
jgi:hypothetical protein